ASPRASCPCRRLSDPLTRLARRRTGSPPANPRGPVATVAMPLSPGFQMNEARLDFGRACVRLRNAQDAGNEKWPATKEFEDLESLVALANQMVRAVGPGDVTDDIGD